jgi:isoleucyl-tRNA synthetase
VPSVHLAGWPSIEVPAEEAAALREAYGVVLEVRDTATKALEEARTAGVIGKSQEARLVVSVPGRALEVLESRTPGALAEMFIVSSVELREAAGDEVAVAVERADGDKCPRCWNIRQLGDDGLCGRCTTVVHALG